MMVHPIGMMRAATGGGGNPAIIGTNEVSPDSIFGASHLIPFHASATTGNFAVVGIVFNGAETTVTAEDAGWVQVGSRVVLGGASTWGEVYAGPVGSGQTEAEFTLGASVTASGASIAFDAGAIGAVSAPKIEAVGTSGSATAVTIGEGSAVVTFVFAGARAANIVMSPTALVTHQPDTYSTSRCLSLGAVEDQSAGTSASVTFSGNYAYYGSLTVEVEPA